jgi:hypothetical protein
VKKPGNIFDKKTVTVGRQNKISGFVEKLNIFASSQWEFSKFYCSTVNYRVGMGLGRQLTA